LAGAEDYLTKPFHLKELAARIEVRLRRASDVKTGADTMLVFDDLVLDTQKCIAEVNGHDAGLTRTEYAILKQLMKNPRRVVTKLQLLDDISEDTPDCSENSLRVHISHLRAKLRKESGKDYIELVWGIGFKMKENGSN
jgi:DNA-binding response OmpR family regulator